MLFKTQHSYTKGLVTSSFFNVLAKGLFFCNSILISYLFGAGNNTDLYFFVAALFVLIGNYVNGVDLLVIIPECMRLREKEGIKKEIRFLNFFLFLYLGIGTLISIFIYLFGITGFFHRISSFSSTTWLFHYSLQLTLFLPYSHRINILSPQLL
jgi:peptidoglycan biosynthesis protein MviN/MurJ (putative lipid II flippase)